MGGDWPAKQENLCCVCALVILFPAAFVSPGEKPLKRKAPPAQGRSTRPQPPAATSTAAAAAASAAVAAAAAAAALHYLMRSRAPEVNA